VVDERRKSPRLGRRSELGRRHAGLHASGPCARVDDDPLQRRQVERDRLLLVPAVPDGDS